MGYVLEGRNHRYIGEANDEKPSLGLQPDGTTVTAADLPPGSTLMEINRQARTVTLYHWTGDDWFVGMPEEQLLGTLQAILFEIASLRENVIEALA